MRVLKFIFILSLVFILFGCNSNNEDSLFETNWDSIKDYYQLANNMEEIDKNKIGYTRLGYDIDGYILNKKDKTINLYNKEEINITGLETITVLTEYIYYYETGNANLFVETRFTNKDVVSDKLTYDVITTKYTFNGEEDLYFTRTKNMQIFIDMINSDIYKAIHSHLEDFVVQ